MPDAPANSAPSVTSTLGAVPPQLPPHPGSLRGLWGVIKHFERSKMSLSLALRNTAGVVIPLIVGYAIGMPRGGLAFGSGALNVSYSDGHDAYAQRAKRMLAAAAWCSIAVLLGGLTAQHFVAAVIVATVWAFIAGMLVALGQAAGDVGVISAVTLVVYAAQPLTPHQAIQAAALALGGGVVQTLFSILLWPVQRHAPERRVLAELFIALAHAAGQPAEAAKSPSSTLEITRAQEALSGFQRDKDLESLRFRSLLNQAERARLGLATVARLRARMARENAGHPTVEVLDKYLDNAAVILRHVARALQTDKVDGREFDPLAMEMALASQLRVDDDDATCSLFFRAALRDAKFQVDALHGQLRAAMELATNATTEGQEIFDKHQAARPWWLRARGSLATLRANLTPRSSVFRHAVRLAATVALGEFVGRWFYWRRSYWIPMTVIVVLKPEFASTFSRGVLRIFGTGIGLIIATVALHFFPGTVVDEIILIAVFMFLLRWVGPGNYGVFAVMITGLIVLMISITGVPPKDVMVARGLNTLAGGALALIAYAAWPTWERTRIFDVLSQLLESYRAYLHAIRDAYRSGERNTRDLDRTRLAARTARTNFETSLDRVAVEPGTTAELVGQLNGIQAAANRFVYAMMSLDAGLERLERPKPRSEFFAFTDAVESTLYKLQYVLSGQRVAEREFPALRALYTRLVESGNSHVELYALNNVEADRMTNSLNTLREKTCELARTQTRYQQGVYANSAAAPSKLPG